MYNRPLWKINSQPRRDGRLYVHRKRLLIGASSCLYSPHNVLFDQTLVPVTRKNSIQTPFWRSNTEAHKLYGTLSRTVVPTWEFDVRSQKTLVSHVVLVRNFLKKPIELWKISNLCSSLTTLFLQRFGLWLWDWTIFPFIMNNCVRRLILSPNVREPVWPLWR